MRDFAPVCLSTFKYIEKQKVELVLPIASLISCSKTRYKPNSPKRAVDARADLLPQEYLNKAKAADQKYNQVQQGTVGPVERKLLSI